MWSLSVILAVFSAVVVDSQTANYSALCTSHTMVIYPPRGPLCSTLYLSGISAEDKALIVNDHNEIRRRVAQGLETRGLPGPQPRAANMKKLRWDNELAREAQQWANQCNFTHDKCRDVDRFHVGQNIYRILSTSNATNVNWTRATMKWYDEVVSFNPANISPFRFETNSSHYTEQLWANTEYIGCGFTFYKSTLAAESKYPYIKYFVCNYGPGGNYLGETMYKVGPACSMCPAGKVCENSLCA